MITQIQKEEIVKVLVDRRKYFVGSDAKYAISIGINNSVYSQLKNGATTGLLSNQIWITLARKLNVAIGNQIVWKPAVTAVYTFVNKELAECQRNAESRIFCDIAGIGKSFAARGYAETNTNAVYIDCSQFKSKQKFVRKLAMEFGVAHTGRIDDVYQDLVFYIQVIENPIIILDEVADLDAQAFLEVKAIWNAANGINRTCAFYMIGANGLKRKINRRINNETSGYAEIFSRFGNKYYKVTPDVEKEQQEYKMVISAEIVAANFPKGTNTAQVIAAADFEPRGLIQELKRLSA